MKKLDIKNLFEKNFKTAANIYVEVPGRVELSGNHTDHQNGKVLASAIKLFTRAAASPSYDNKITIISEGFEGFSVDLKDLSPKKEEINTSSGLVRGLAKALMPQNIENPGFNAYISSEIPRGSGLSSSAAFEMTMAKLMNEFWNLNFPALALAKAGQFAENVYWNKPCGLMDELCCILGKTIFIDFENPKNPLVQTAELKLLENGFAFYIINSKAGHENLTEEYAAIPNEIKKICQHFGKSVLREIPEESFYKECPLLRKNFGDRAVLRALHVYEENKRVLLQEKALKENDFSSFLNLVRESGLSSWRFLQNVSPIGQSFHQEMAFSLAIAEKLLQGQGACRLQGGGFGGYIESFVPLDLCEDFEKGIKEILGEDSIIRIEI